MRPHEIAHRLLELPGAERADAWARMVEDEPKIEAFRDLVRMHMQIAIDRQRFGIKKGKGG